MRSKMGMRQRSSALAGVSVAALAMLISPTAAAAQEIGQSIEDEQTIEEEGEPILVTGSRIARRDAESNSPLVTVGTESLENRSSVAIADVLNELPQFAPAAQTGGSGSATSTPGAALVNLRGLGSNRSLVLINGKRPQPINATLAVDTNTIPAAAVKNIEVITGGAASVYGADAIAGVVNFTLRDDFEGFEVDAQYGLSEQGDNEEYSISTLVGASLADGRGNVMLGLSYSRRGEVLQRDRDFYTRGWNDPDTLGITINNASLNRYVPGGGQPDVGINPDGSLFYINDAANPARPFTGALNAGPGGSGYKIDRTGVLTWTDPDAVASSPLSRYSIFASATYDVTDDITFFADGMATKTKTSSRGQIPPAFSFWSASVPYNQANDDPDSPTFGEVPNATFHPVSEELADLLNANGVSGRSWTLARGLGYVGPALVETDNQIFQINAGFRGAIPGTEWTWEVYGSYGETRGNTRLTGVPSASRIGQILQQDNYGEGFNPVIIPVSVDARCTSGIPIFNPDGSVPFDPVREGVAVSQDCLDYIDRPFNNVSSLKQTIGEATLQGDLIELPAGPLQFAVGAGYRKEDFSYTPDSGFSTQAPTPDFVNQISLSPPVEGAFDVYELYGELLVPVVSDLPLVDNLSFELGYRYSKYSSVGGVQTYKALGDWEVTDWLRFRGGYQLANRAPNVAELFSPVASVGDGPPSYDPCARFPGFTPEYGNDAANPNLANVLEVCKYLIERDGGIAPADMSTFNITPGGVGVPFQYALGRQQGNPNLDSEEAKTWTIGGVMRSPFESALLSSLTLAVDWYSIALDGAIGYPTNNTVYQQCLDPQYNSAIGGSPGSVTGAEIAANNPYCQLINREAPSGLARNYDALYINQGGIKTSGWDIQFNWRPALEDLGIGSGHLNVSILANILDKYEVQPFAGAEWLDYTGTLENASYDYKVFTSVSYDADSWSLGTRISYLPKIDAAPGAALDTRGADAHTEVDLFGQLRITDSLTLRAGVENLLNADPEVVNALPGIDENLGTTAPQYDVIGRRFFAGVRASF